MQTNLVTANDNSPVRAATASHSDNGLDLLRDRSWYRQQTGGVIFASKHSPIKRRAYIQNTHMPVPVSTVLTARRTKTNKRQKTSQKISKFPVYLLLLLWLVAAASIARFAGGLTGNLLNGESLAGAGGGLGLLSLALASVARRRHAKISHSIGIASACVCLVGLGWFYFEKSSVAIPLEFLVRILAVGSLILAKFWRMPFLLHLSLLLAIGWSVHSFLNTQVSELVWLFPALWSIQMFLALEFRIRRTITLCIFTGLLWISVNLFLLT